MPSLPPTFVACLHSALGTPTAPLSLHEPEFGEREWLLVKDCLESGWVSSVGRYVDAFEQQLAAFTGARHAVAVVNGTAALHVALLLAGVGADDEVLMPALTFVATANAVAYCGAHPHFIDCDDSTFGLDPQALAAHLAHIAERTPDGWRNRLTGRKLAAILPVHIFGIPARLPEIIEVAGQYDLPVVEDAAEALGTFRNGQHAGTFGQFGTLSFNGNKIITTGGGGALLTNDTELARQAKHLTTTAKLPHAWSFVHDRTAFNYRLPNINAALGCAQLERLPEFLGRKARLAERYAQAFSPWQEGNLVTPPPGTTANHWLNAVRLVHPDAAARDRLLADAHAAGFMCRPVWDLMHHLPMYAACPRSELPVAEALAASLINLPSGPALEPAA